VARSVARPAELDATQGEPSLRGAKAVLPAAESKLSSSRLADQPKALKEGERERLHKRATCRLPVDIERAPERWLSVWQQEPTLVPLDTKHPSARPLRIYRF